MNELYKKRINFLVTNSQTKKKVQGHHKNNEEKVQKKSELKNLSYDKTKSEKQKIKSEKQKFKSEKEI